MTKCPDCARTVLREPMHIVDRSGLDEPDAVFIEDVTAPRHGPDQAVALGTEVLQCPRCIG